VALFNPKTMLFFAAFLPQFLTSAGAPLPQGMMLGGLFVAIAARSDSLYALTLGTLAGRLGGTLPIGLGLLAAAGGPRGAKWSPRYRRQTASLARPVTTRLRPPRLAA